MITGKSAEHGIRADEQRHVTRNRIAGTNYTDYAAIPRRRWRHGKGLTACCAPSLARPHPWLLVLDQEHYPAIRRIALDQFRLAARAVQGDRLTAARRTGDYPLCGEPLLDQQLAECLSPA